MSSFAALSRYLAGLGVLCPESSVLLVFDYSSFTSVEITNVGAQLAFHGVPLCRDWTLSSPPEEPCRAVFPKLSLPSLVFPYPWQEEGAPLLTW